MSNGRGLSRSQYYSRVSSITIVGVQTAGAPAAYRAWAGDTLAPTDQMETMADGVATRVPFALTTRVLREYLADFRLVTDDAIRAAVVRLYEDEHVLAEGAPAAAVAAALEVDSDLAGETVVIPITGGNVDTDRFEALLAEREETN